MNTRVKAQVDDWRDAEFVTVQAAAKLAGLSSASIYTAAAKGQIEFRRLIGRTLVPVASLKKFLDSAEPWQASERGSAGRTARVERARAAWAD